MLLRDSLYFCCLLLFIFIFVFFASVDVKVLGLISQAEMYFRNQWNKGKLFFSVSSWLHWYSDYFVKDWRRGPEYPQRTHRWTSFQAMILKIAILLFMMLIPYVWSFRNVPQYTHSFSLKSQNVFHIHPRTVRLLTPLQPPNVFQEQLRRVQERSIMLLWSLAPDNFPYVWWNIN